MEHDFLQQLGASGTTYRERPTLHFFPDHASGNTSFLGDGFAGLPEEQVITLLVQLMKCWCHESNWRRINERCLSVKGPISPDRCRLILFDRYGENGLYVLICTYKSSTPRPARLFMMRSPNVEKLALCMTELCSVFERLGYGAGSIERERGVLFQYAFAKK